MTGVTLAFSQQFRFAAAESVALERAGQAISFYSSWEPWGPSWAPSWWPAASAWWRVMPFWVPQGAFVLFLVAVALLLAMRQTEATEGAAAVGEARPIREILQAPLFRLAVAAGVVGQGVMVFIMTATPVSMHVMDGHDLATTAGVIRAHVLAMYIPSLVSGLFDCPLWGAHPHALGRGNPCSDLGLWPKWPCGTALHQCAGAAWRGVELPVCRRHDAAS